jgi:hypothetical protein
VVLKKNLLLEDISSMINILIHPWMDDIG